MPDLLEPLSYVFMQRGLLAAVLVGITCATLGTYVVLRQMAFIGDALAHTALPGLVVAHMMGWSLFLGALIADLLTAAGIGAITKRKEIREDTAIGILFTGMFACGILLISKAGSMRDLTHMLFGNILGVSQTDLILMAVIAGVVLTTLFLVHKELELVSVDPSYAAMIGIRPARMRLLLLFLLALTVVVGIQIVGVVLTSSMLSTPAATASLITRRLRSLMAVAAVVAVSAGVLGLFGSYYFNLPSGAAIVLICTLAFVMVYVGKRIALRSRAVEPD